MKRGEGNAWETRSTLPHLATCNGRALLDGEPYIIHTLHFCNGIEKHIYSEAFALQIIHCRYTNCKNALCTYTELHHVLFKHWKEHLVYTKNGEHSVQFVHNAWSTSICYM